MNTPTPPAAGLAHVPITVFASVMGVGGLGLAWRKAAPLMGLPTAIGKILLAIGAALFVMAAITYGLKVIRHPQACLGEFNHPIRSCFFAAISISMMLLATGLHPHAAAPAELLWKIGAVLQLAFTVRVFARWIVHRQEITHANPVWFIPIVGNIIVPVLGVKLGQTDVSWFFFSIGMALWLPMLAIILNRVIFHDDLPPRMVPTLFIMVPPPAIGYLAYAGLVGQVDSFATILVNLALFITLTLLAMAPRFARLPFAVSWWAFTFPLDAAALAFIEHGHRNPGNWLFAIAAPLALGLASAVVALVLVRTIAGTVNGTLFVPE